MIEDHEKPPIFVVGVPRSGTTLLAAMLSAHSQLSCGPETRFFHFLDKTVPETLCELRSWPGEAVSFLYETNLVGRPVAEHYELTREEIHTYLTQHSPTIPTILKSLTDQFRISKGKSRWVEKSPEHLLHVHTIRKYFPTSPIIRIVRDPRDVALSMLKAPWAPSDFLEALMLWCHYDDRSASFFLDDENSYTLYYENLVEHPHAELEQLCAFIDEKFEPQMLDTSRSAENVVADNEVWHRIVNKPIDKTRIQVWKRETSKEQNRVAEALIGDRLITNGYECVENLDQVAIVYPSIGSLVRHRGALLSFVAEGIRFWHSASNDSPHLLIFAGQPDNDQWLRYEKPGRWWDALRIVTQLVKSKLARRPIYWIREPNEASGLGFSSRLLALFFHFTSVRQTV